jgi:hypothetical protein
MSLNKAILLFSFSLFFVCGYFNGRQGVEDWLASFFLYSLSLFWILPFCTGKPMSLPYSSEMANKGERDGYRYFLFSIFFALALVVLVK